MKPVGEDLICEIKIDSKLYFTFNDNYRLAFGRSVSFNESNGLLVGGIAEDIV